MHLKRFNEFARDLADDSPLKSSVHAVQVVRHFEGTWYREDGSEIQNQRLIKDLISTLKLDRHWRRKNHTRAFFPVKPLDTVVVGIFQVKPAEGTRQKIHEQIQSCFKRSSDSYRARHDGLTGLLNRSALDAILVEKFQQFQAVAPVTGDTQGDAGVSFTSLVFVMLDIDFFKRVNDSYGHTYGDVVLKSFAIRLERACEMIEKNESYNAEVFCARLSGEEFAVLIAGHVAPDAEIAIAEVLRNAIISRHLPDDSELRVLTRDPKLRGLQFPPVTERKITPSVGLSSRHSGIASEPSETAAERLKVEADLALYRAKALGRDRCVRFCDIVERHGQVIQHHTDVDVVAIDVGQQVGVSLGQEFLVFHPDFVGDKDFVFGDGRSERRLGCYPRVPHGRLEVFDVQPEIAFCYVAEKRGMERFPVGSLLEAVPVGSIAHLISKDWWRWRDLHKLAPGPGDVDRELLKVDPWDTAGVACLRLSNKEKLLDARGVGLVNRIYASLYNELRETFKRDLVAHLGTDAFAVVIRNDPADMEERLLGLSERIEESYDSLPIVSIGFFVQTLAGTQSEVEDEECELAFKHGLRYASAALELAVRRQARFVPFRSGTVGELLNVLRRNNEHEAIDQIYDGFQSIGFRSSQMEGEVAIATLIRRDYGKAIEMINRAIDIAPGRSALRLNKGLILVASGKALDAADIFEEIPAQEGEAEVYKAARVIANLRKFQQGSRAVDKDTLIESLREIRPKRSLLRFLGMHPFDITLALVQVRKQGEAALNS